VLARLQLESGARPLAVAILEEVTLADPQNVAAGAMLAGLLVEDGRLREAQALLDRLRMVAGHDPVVQALIHGRADDPFDTPNWAERLASYGDYPRATRAWQRIYQANPRDVRAKGRLIELSRALDGLGDGGSDQPRPGGGRHRLPGAGELTLALLDDFATAPPPTGDRPVHRWAQAYWG